MSFDSWRPDPAVLALEDGTCFTGISVGAAGETSGEAVFNTSMTGYQEVLTDPSYAGQIVTMTCPEIGNCGVTPEDRESAVPRVAGLVVRQASLLASNWRSRSTLQQYLIEHGIVAIAGIDTRALTRRLRSAGVMRAVLAAGTDDASGLVERARQVPPMEGADLVAGVTSAAPWEWGGDEAVGDVGAVPPDGLSEFAPAARPARRRLRVVAFDFGIKRNILRRLAAHQCDIRVFPAAAPPSDLLAINPDGLFLSNGPGDPAAVGYAIDHVRALVRSGLPVFGICLGHQILALALGARTFKLKFGHRGSNHPVRNLETGMVEITSQNHGFAVDPASLPDEVMLTHVSLYDGTVEGYRHRTLPVACVQYHPEASPGPHDADYLFGQFIDAMQRTRD
ncbi:MAG: glutamine-hydrolyzing carbamoyl-phosphate synthase small subunit [Acidobacteria bacterium]|nr:glutamine-hydrolyzing carbamoyl-phosphate synthase small subunit [Acidobacteriota bacterium]